MYFNTHDILVGTICPLVSSKPLGMLPNCTTRYQEDWLRATSKFIQCSGEKYWHLGNGVMGLEVLFDLGVILSSYAHLCAFSYSRYSLGYFKVSRTKLSPPISKACIWPIKISLQLHKHLFVCLFACLGYICSAFTPS